MTQSRTRATLAAGACLGIAGLIVGLVVLVLWLRGDLDGPRGADSRDLPEASPTKKEGDSLAVAPGDPATAGTIESLWVVTGRVVEVRADDVPPDLVSLPWKPEKRPPPRPAAGVRLRLVRSDAPSASPSVAASPSVTVTREDGGFEFSGVPSGVPLEISVDEPGRCAATMTLVLGKPEIVSRWPVEWKGAGFAPRIDVGTIESGSCETLTVEVTDLWRAPVTGALVRAGLLGGPDVKFSDGYWSLYLSATGESSMGERAHRAEVVAPGVYLFRGLYPGRHDVHVEAEGWAASWEIVVIPRAEPLSISLELGAEIRGRVVDTSGNPIEGAVLSAERNSSARTDSDGRFALRHLGVSNARFKIPFVRGLPRTTLTAMAIGYVPLVTRVEAAADDLEIALFREARISGTVVRAADGAPVSSAWLSLEGRDGHGTDDCSGTTGPFGTFELGGIPPGAYRLRAEHDDHLPSETQDLDLHEGERIADLRLELQAGLSRVVVVRDAASGAPVSGATVEEGGVERRTGDDGTCTFAALQVGSISFSVRSPGYCLIEDAEVLVSETPEPIEFRLEVGGTILGRVVGPDGTPVVGARIGTSSQEKRPSSPRETDSEEESTRVAKLPRGRWRDWTSSPPLSGPDGRFRLDDLVVTRQYSVYATFPGLAPAAVSGISVDPKQEPVEVELRLPRGGSIEVQVVSDSGVPIRGVAIEAWALETPFEMWKLGLGDCPRGWWFPSSKTDESGTARLENLPSGEFTVRATSKDYLLADDAKVHVEDGLVVPLRRVLLEGYVLSGRVLTQDGEPVVGAEFRCNGDWEVLTRSGSDGRFRLGGLPTGTLSFDVECWGFGTTAFVTHVPADALEVRMVAVGRVSGRVAVPSGNRLPPMPAIEIESWEACTNTVSCEIDRTGGFAVALPPGRYRFSFQSAVAALASEQREVEVRAGEHVRLEVELRPAGNVSVLVVEAETGAPVPGATVWVESSEGAVLPSGPPRKPGEASGSLEDSRERYERYTRVRHSLWVPAGTFTLRVTDYSYRPQRIAGLSVEPGQSLEVVAALEGGTGIHGLVTRGGARVVGARVTCGPKGGPATGEAWTDVGGCYELPLSERGHYREYEVRVEAPDGKMATAATHVEAGRWTDLPLDLTPVRLHGRVLAGGRPFVGARVHCVLTLASRRFQGDVDEDGYYEVLLEAGGGPCIIYAIDDEGTHSAKLEIDVPLDVSDFERDIELP